VRTPVLLSSLCAGVLARARAEGSGAPRRNSRRAAQLAASAVDQPSARPHHLCNSTSCPANCIHWMQFAHWAFLSHLVRFSRGVHALRRHGHAPKDRAPRNTAAPPFSDGCVLCMRAALLMAGCEIPRVMAPSRNDLADRPLGALRAHNDQYGAQGHRPRSPAPTGFCVADAQPQKQKRLVPAGQWRAPDVSSKVAFRAASCRDVVPRGRRPLRCQRAWWRTRALCREGVRLTAASGVAVRLPRPRWLRTLGWLAQEPPQGWLAQEGGTPGDLLGDYVGRVRG
jgi:hypothetical protein